MHEEVEMYLDEAQSLMAKAVEHLERELVKVRAGRASTHMLDGILVEYYGTPTALSKIANIGVSDARTIVIQPWEKKQIPHIEKAILKANIGFNPDNNGELIRINVPPLNEERRRDLVRQARHEGEQSKISIRSIRKETNEQLKTLKKDGVPEDDVKKGEDNVQKFTDDHIAKIEKLVAAKEKDILTV